MEKYNIDNRKLLICLSNPTNLEHIATSIRMYFGDILDIIAVPPSRLFDLTHAPAAAVVSHLTVQLWTVIRNSRVNDRINVGGINPAAGRIGDHVDVVDPQLCQRIHSFMSSGERFVDNQCIGASRQTYHFFQSLP